MPGSAQQSDMGVSGANVTVARDFRQCSSAHKVGKTDSHVSTVFEAMR